MALSEHEQKQFDLLTNGFLEENPDIAKKVKKVSARLNEKDVAPPSMVYRSVMFLMFAGLGSLALGMFIANPGLIMMGMPMATFGVIAWMFLPAHYKQGKVFASTAKTKSPFMQRLENAWDERTKD